VASYNTAVYDSGFIPVFTLTFEVSRFSMEVCSEVKKPRQVQSEIEYEFEFLSLYIFTDEMTLLEGFKS